VSRGGGRRVVMATASYRFYSREIAERLGFDDCIGTNSILGLDERVHAKIDGENCYGPAKLRMIQAWLASSGLLSRLGAHANRKPLYGSQSRSTIPCPQARR